MEIFYSQNHLHCYCLQLKGDENIKTSAARAAENCRAEHSCLPLKDKIKLHLRRGVST